MRIDTRAYCSVRALVQDNPAYRTLYMAALARCDGEDVPYEDVLDAVDGLRTEACQVQEAASIVQSLVRRGGLAQTVVVDGEPFAGTLADVQADESVPVDADVRCMLRATDEGALALRDLRDELSLDALLAEKPRYKDAFVKVLELCSSASGATTSELQPALDEAGYLFRDGRTGLPTVYPSYFTGELERIGALAWNEKRWHTTEQGGAALLR